MTFLFIFVLTVVFALFSWIFFNTSIRTIPFIDTSKRYMEYFNNKQIGIVSQNLYLHITPLLQSGKLYEESEKENTAEVVRLFDSRALEEILLWRSRDWNVARLALLISGVPISACEGIGDTSWGFSVVQVPDASKLLPSTYTALKTYLMMKYPLIFSENGTLEQAFDSLDDTYTEYPNPYYVFNDHASTVTFQMVAEKVCSSTERELCSPPGQTFLSFLETFTSAAYEDEPSALRAALYSGLDFTEYHTNSGVALNLNCNEFLIPDWPTYLKKGSIVYQCNKLCLCNISGKKKSA